MFLPPELAYIFSMLFQMADLQCRAELRDGVIVDEPGYMERLMGKIRDILSQYPEFNFHVQNLPGGLETYLGADSIFIFQYNSQIKIGLAEAKWPRANINDNYRWDSIQASNNNSHFSDQLLRQSNWNDMFAIWEMFLFEGDYTEDSPPFDSWGSSCVEHEVAINYMKDENLKQNMWSTENVKELLATNRKSFQEIIFNILICDLGRAWDFHSIYNSATSSINLRIDEKTHSIPIPRRFNNENENNANSITNYMKKNGFQNYFFISIDF